VSGLPLRGRQHGGEKIPPRCHRTWTTALVAALVGDVMVEVPDFGAGGLTGLVWDRWERFIAYISEDAARRIVELRRGGRNDEADVVIMLALHACGAPIPPDD
jgi:hypothetical protein